MRVLFLDIDGVLNTFMKFSHSGDFSKTACENVQSLLNEFPDLQIVISSSWRAYGLTACKDVLKSNGIDPHRIIDTTDMQPEAHTKHSKDREHHIERWLRNHPNVSNYVIIDDEMEAPDLKEHYVKTNSYIGFTKKELDEAIKILNKKDKMH